MKEKLGTLLLILCVAVAGYVTVSTAAMHTARDHAALKQWSMEWSSRK